MTEFQQTTKELNTYRVLVLCAIVILLEGFDIQAAGVSATKLTLAFNLAPFGKGMFLGASAVGIFIASILGGFLADKYGRRPIVVSGVIIFGIFSLSTLLAKGLGTLIAARFMTGLGLGSAMPAVIAYASDHSPEYMKKRAVGFIYCAIPIGGLLSGVVMQAGIFGSDWRPVYLVGGIAPIVVAPFLFMLPKSLPRIGNSPESPASRVNILSGLLGKGQFNKTIFLWMATFGTLLVMYLLLGWMPSLLVAMGLSQSQSQYVQMIFNVGGVCRSGRRRIPAGQEASISDTRHSLCCIGIVAGNFGIFGARFPFGFDGGIRSWSDGCSCAGDTLCICASMLFSLDKKYRSRSSRCCRASRNYCRAAIGRFIARGRQNRGRRFNCFDPYYLGIRNNGIVYDQDVFKTKRVVSTLDQ